MRRKFTYYVYILTNKYNTTLYIGVTNSISKRLFEHKFGLMEGFTKKYKVKKLVYLEEYSDINRAIAREKQLKNWHRDWKLNLIKKVNPKLENMSIFD
ncbi:MAG: GIY-YIG nuclease family protein [Candidatus Levybacteria bacterium]|nr:GIY-YIG nuclease family protein [Candidatus Levybacteria bacterium]